MDKEFWELETGKVLSTLELLALQKGWKLVVLVDKEGNISNHYDFLRHVPFARSDN